MAFTPIETQEQLEEVLKNRLERERKTVEARFSDYEDIKGQNQTLQEQLSNLNEQLQEQQETSEGLNQTIADLNQKVQKYESDSAKTRIALEAGLPYGMAQRLSGGSEEELRADAESLKKLMAPKEAAPMYTAEPTDINETDAAYAQLLSNLKGD